MRDRRSLQRNCSMDFSTLGHDLVILMQNGDQFEIKASFDLNDTIPLFVKNGLSDNSCESQTVGSQ